MSEKEGAAVGLAMLAIFCLFLVALAHETPKEKPCLSASGDARCATTKDPSHRYASADTRHHPMLTTREHVAGDPVDANTAAASTTALKPLDSPRKPVENQPMPAPMYDALARHFSQYEAARLCSLYAEVKDKDIPVADIRDRAKEILGDEGFKILMTEASPPAGVQPNTDEMVQYVLSRPALGWWHSLRE